MTPAGVNPLRLRAPGRRWTAGLALAAAVLFPRAAWGQDGSGSWAAVPSMGFGVVRDGGDWGSGGLELSLGAEHARGAWRWRAEGSFRGVGVECSHACVDGGWWWGAGVSRATGRASLGGGLGVSNHFGGWRLQPYAGVGLEREAWRLGLRLEVPVDGAGVYLPLALSLRVPRSSR